VYFNEQMVSFEKLETSFSFEKFLKEFSEKYKSGKQSDIEMYINPDVDLVSASNPGAYCAPGISWDSRPKFIGNFIITNQKPNGDFCEGYNGAKDGLYYEFIDELGLPEYYDMSGDGGTIVLTISPDIEYFYFAKVLVITEEYFNRYLYFFNGNDKWYFWIEDFCDCSA